MNYINAKGAGQVPDNAANRKLYYNVNGDNFVVATDVIDIVNYINAGRSQGGEAEGEDLAVVASDSAAGNNVMALVAMDVAAQ